MGEPQRAAPGRGGTAAANAQRTGHSAVCAAAQCTEAAAGPAELERETVNGLGKLVPDFRWDAKSATSTEEAQRLVASFGLRREALLNQWKAASGQAPSARIEAACTWLHNHFHGHLDTCRVAGEARRLQGWCRPT